MPFSPTLPLLSLPCPPPPSLKPLLLSNPRLPHRLRRVRHHQRPLPSAVAASRRPEYSQWDSMTSKLAGASNFPFLLIQLPQIVLNSQNLLAGNHSALFAVPWLGMLTGLLGNLTLLSYFVKKKEMEAVVVQTLGVVSIYVIIVQLAMAGAVRLPYFMVISAVVAAGLVLNFLNYLGWLSDRIWCVWEDFITITGLSVLPQVMWSTFVPFIPKSILPGLVSSSIAVVAVIMARLGKLPERGVRFVQSISGWTATLLFMWMPIAQMWTNCLNPDNIKGLSAFTMLLGMIGNGLMIPRALFIRDLMWFTGSSWASFLHGWGNLLCMYCFSSISKEFFLAATVSLYAWLGTVMCFLVYLDIFVRGLCLSVFKEIRRKPAQILASKIVQAVFVLGRVHIGLSRLNRERGLLGHCRQLNVCKDSSSELELLREFESSNCNPISKSTLCTSFYLSSLVP